MWEKVNDGAGTFIYRTSKSWGRHSTGQRAAGWSINISGVLKVNDLDQQVKFKKSKRSVLPSHFIHNCHSSSSRMKLLLTAAGFGRWLSGARVQDSFADSNTIMAGNLAWDSTAIGSMASYCIYRVELNRHCCMCLGMMESRLQIVIVWLSVTVFSKLDCENWILSSPYT